MLSVLVLNRWAPSRQGNSQSSLLQHRAIQRWYHERETENNEINRLDKATLADAVVPPTSLVVPRLGTCTCVRQSIAPYAVRTGLYTADRVDAG